VITIAAIMRKAIATGTQAGDQFLRTIGLRSDIVVLSCLAGGSTTGLSATDAYGQNLGR
jgi:hypothetical protein